MRLSYVIVLIAMLISAIAFWYIHTENMCPVPLGYKLGTVDASFDLSESDARSYIAEAEAVWEERVNRDLFVYDESADLTVNFIFDDRQAEANSEAAQRSELDAKRDENDAIVATLQGVQEDYDELSAGYETQVANYENRLDAYNSKVNQYNDRGGAPSDVFAELEDERIALEREAADLSQTARELNQLAEEVNEIGQRAEQEVNRYNREVNRYNQQYGYEREFTQGDFQRDRINIYKFSSEDELISVLAHEFGHALGIGHVEEESALMYYLLDETDFEPALSGEDIIAYQQVCSVEETFAQRVRHLIRTYVPFL